MPVLVIGGSGFIGSVVVRALSESNVETICYDLIHTNNNGAKNNWIRADILELQSIERIFFEYSVDAIIHLIGLPAIDYCKRNPHFSFLLNVLSVQNALEAMRMADIPKIVFASSATVYGYHHSRPLGELDETRPSTLYGSHKLIAEKTIRAYQENYGIKGVILRLFNVYGGDPKLGKEVISIFINRALRGEPLLVKGPGQFRDYVHISDVGQAFAKAVTSDKANDLTINVGTGTKTTLRQVAAIVHSCFPRLKIVEEMSPDDATGWYGDIQVARDVLGFCPRSPEQGIRAHVEKYCNEPQIESIIQ